MKIKMLLVGLLFTFSVSSLAEVVKVAPKNWAKEVKKGWWEWGIYLDGAPGELDKVDRVVYKLHKSFRNRYQVRENRSEQFELRANGWGTFTVEVMIFVKGSKEGKTWIESVTGKDIVLKHSLRFHGVPKDRVKWEGSP